MGCREQESERHNKLDTSLEPVYEWSVSLSIICGSYTFISDYKDNRFSAQSLPAAPTL